MPRFILALIKSRKFWLTFLGVIGAVVLYVQGAITPDQLVDAIMAFVGILVAAIAYEDGAAKQGKA